MQIKKYIRTYPTLPTERPTRNLKKLNFLETFYLVYHLGKKKKLK